jgi:hypothetical protein
MTDLPLAPPEMLSDCCWDNENVRTASTGGTGSSDAALQVKTYLARVDLIIDLHGTN